MNRFDVKPEASARKASAIDSHLATFVSLADEFVRLDT
jgi:hypothetical protein